MDTVALGALSAVSLGSADFIARFTSRQFGAASGLLGVLVLSALVLTAYLAFVGFPTRWPLGSAWLLVAYGMATALATLLLYEALARGPVTIAAPIVSAHPALIVGSATVLGNPSGPIQLLAIAATIGGAVITARFTTETSLDRSAGAARGAVAIATAACICYAALVVFGQKATLIYGDLQTVWGGRIVAILTILPLIYFLPVRERGPGPLSRIMLPLLALQGVLDIGGHLLLFAGSQGAQPQIVAVVASSFGAVTTLFGFFILRERVSLPQWSGIVLVFVGVAVLSISTPA
jgi:drug/metabolite transporter (DMT)-like permease